MRSMEFEKDEIFLSAEDLEKQNQVIKKTQDEVSALQQQYADLSQQIQKLQSAKATLVEELQKAQAEKVEAHTQRELLEYKFEQERESHNAQFNIALKAVHQLSKTVENEQKNHDIDFWEIRNKDKIAQTEALKVGPTKLKR